MENKMPFREANLKIFQRIVESEDNNFGYEDAIPLEELEEILSNIDFSYTGIYDDVNGATAVELDTIDPGVDDVRVVISPHDGKYYVGAYLKGKRTTTETGDNYDELTAEVINDAIYSFIDENEDLFND